jgi:hypothetical protein
MLEIVATSFPANGLHQADGFNEASEIDCEASAAHLIRSKSFSTTLGVGGGDPGGVGPGGFGVGGVGPGETGGSGGTGLGTCGG